MERKTRLINPSVYTRVNRVYGTSASYDGWNASNGRGAQYVLTEGHLYRNLGKGGNIGGPFTSQRCELEIDPDGPIQMGDGPGGAYERYEQPFPSIDDFGLAEIGAWMSQDQLVSKISSVCPPLVSGLDLDSAGATAINRCKPTNPVVDGAATIAELISERKFFAIPGRNGSLQGEYLNYQLGISPTLGAIADFRKAVESSDKVLKQLHRDNGKPVRRRYEFPTEHSPMEVSVSHGVWPFTQSGTHLGFCESGTLEVRTWSTTKKWFSGSFTYFLPEDIGVAQKVAELDRLYGVKPGIDTAWELVPLSFVADYFVNLGDVISNANSFAQDGLVLVYGYMMAETTVEVHSTWTGVMKINGTWQDTRLSSKRFYVNKQRRPASPFGFGLTEGDLSPRQLSILAALGLSRR